MSQVAKSELLELMALWQNNGLTPLAYVIGFSQTLLEGDRGDLNEEQRQVLKLIFRNGVRAADCWRSAADYTRLRYGPPQKESNAIEISQVVNGALSHLKKLTTISHIKTDIPADLPLVKAYMPLDAVFIYLLDAPPLRHYLLNKPLTIKIRYHEKERITVQILMEPIRHANMAESFFYPGTSPTVAQLIVEHHGGKMLLKQDEEKTEIVFDLPIWDDLDRL